MSDTHLHAMARRALATAAGYRELFPTASTGRIAASKAKGPARLELSPADQQVLIAIWLEPAATVGQIAERLNLRQPSVSRALSRLAEASLCREQADADDARVRRQTLTSKGRRIVEELLIRMHENACH